PPRVQLEEVTPEETPPKPKRIGVIWSPEARADLRAIDRETAMDILHCLDRYLKNREGDIKKLKPPRTDFRLFFDQVAPDSIHITRVRNRREAYRSAGLWNPLFHSEQPPTRTEQT